MSYSITLKAENGTVTVATVSGTVPDGTYSISGHEDANYVNLSAQRTDANGHLVANANQSTGKAAFPAEVTQ